MRATAANGQLESPRASQYEGAVVAQKRQLCDQRNGARRLEEHGVERNLVIAGSSNAVGRTSGHRIGVEDRVDERFAKRAVAVSPNAG